MHLSLAYLAFTSLETIKINDTIKQLTMKWIKRKASELYEDRHYLLKTFIQVVVISSVTSFVVAYTLTRYVF